MILLYRAIRHCQKSADKHSSRKSAVDIADLETSMVAAMEKSSANIIMHQGNLQTTHSNLFQEDEEIVATPVTSNFT